MSTNAHAEAMNEMIESVHKAEDETNRLKRKYEPDKPEVLLDKILELSDENSLFYMRVEIFTGSYMMLTLIPSKRNNGNVPDWGFKPSIAGTHDNVEDFGMFGIYRVYVGDGGDGRGRVRAVQRQDVPSCRGWRQPCSLGAAFAPDPRLVRSMGAEQFQIFREGFAFATHQIHEVDGLHQ